MIKNRNFLVTAEPLEGMEISVGSGYSVAKNHFAVLTVSLPV